VRRVWVPVLTCENPTRAGGVGDLSASVTCDLLVAWVTRETRHRGNDMGEPAAMPGSRQIGRYIREVAELRSS
jgi:hypothetical protein